MIELDAVIVGGGFSGCAVAIGLARRAGPDFSLCLFEPDELGRGAAYSTPHAEQLLNTRARAMSLYPGDPDDFVRWLGPRGGPADFVSRRLFGQYVAENAKRAFERSRFSIVHDRIAVVRRDAQERFVVESSRGQRYLARTVVLATGNATPDNDFLPRETVAHPGYVGDPWRFDYRVVAGDVLLIGSGLTALDALVALDACGHRGAVHAVSRRGRFPEVHAEVAPYDVVPAVDGADARTILRSFRRHVLDAARRGYDWRAVIDAVRPEGEAIWRRLSPREQRRFERHLRVHWERHRHRAPQKVDDVRKRYRRSGRLFNYAGRLVAMHRGNATVALGDGSTIELRPDWIVNCTGPGRNALPFETGPLEIRVNAGLAALDASGEPVAGLWVVGPPVRRCRFEATAVPEVRAMADLVAGEVLRTLATIAAGKGQAPTALLSSG